LNIFKDWAFSFNFCVGFTIQAVAFWVCSKARNVWLKANEKCCSVWQLLVSNGAQFKTQILYADVHSSSSSIDNALIPVLQFNGVVLIK